MKSARLVFGVCGVVALGLLAGCGSSSTPSSESTASSPAPKQGEAGKSPSGEAAPSEAESAATGDIPDNQTFLVYRDPGTGYAIRYPEGWARKRSGPDVTFREKANVIHLTVGRGASPTPASVLAELSKLKSADPTGIDRYVYVSGGKVAVLDLATPVGVDNVDAYRMISESFRWHG